MHRLLQTSSNPVLEYRPLQNPTWRLDHTVPLCSSYLLLTFTLLQPEKIRAAGQAGRSLPGAAIRNPAALLLALTPEEEAALPSSRQRLCLGAEPAQHAAAGTPARRGWRELAARRCAKPSL